MKLLECQIDQSADGKVTMVFHGALDEVAELVFPPQTNQEVEINLKGVTHLNSAGVLKWIRFVEAMEEQSDAPKFYLVEVPHFVADQMGKIHNFLGKRMRVDSVYVPFYCQQCESQISSLYEKGKQFILEKNDIKIHHGDQSCRQCGSPLEIDIVPEVFFQFLKKS